MVEQAAGIRGDPCPTVLTLLRRVTPGLIQKYVPGEKWMLCSFAQSPITIMVRGD